MESETPYLHRSMADGCAELIFHYKGLFDELSPGGMAEKSFTAGIHAQSQRVRRFITDQSFGIFGVYLYPFAIPSLFAVPANELTNEMIDLQTLLGNDGKVLEEQIMLASNNQERTTILSHFLYQLLCRSKPDRQGIFSIINYIIENEGIPRVDELADQCALSMRQFERKFKTYSGFTPKLFSRIIRFQSATQEYDKNNKTLTELAYDCGYYDQSHFISDFKEFSGHHPKTFFHGKAEGTEWRNEESLIKVEYK